MNTSSIKQHPLGHRVWSAWDTLCDISPIVVMRRSTLLRNEERVMELGRDVGRAERRKEMSAVAAMLSAITESVTTRQPAR